MRRMYEFACINGHKTDRFVVYETTSLMCDCGEETHRILSAPAFRLEGWSGSFPTAHGKFDKSHTNKLKSERKINS
jgi:hypothetical protein